MRLGINTYFGPKLLKRSRLMQNLLETILLFLLRKLLTPELIKGAEQAFIHWLKGLAADTSNKIDDYMVEVIADALGIPYDK